MAVKRVGWTSGSQRALVRDGFALLLSESVRLEDAVAIWDRLAGEQVRGLGSLLEILSDVTGSALTSLPDFAMAVLDDKGLHVAARGALLARVVRADGSGTDLDGRDVSTWVERNFDAADSAQVVLGADDSDGAWLPLVGGVVPAGALLAALTDGTLPAVEPQPEHTPVVEPEPLLSARSTVETLAEVEVDEPDVRDEPDDVEPPAAPARPVPDVDAPDVREPEAADEPEPIGRFAHLFSPHTVLHDIEEAAVRPVEHDEVAPAGADAGPDPAPEVSAPADDPAPAQVAPPSAEPSAVPSPGVVPRADVLPTAQPATPSTFISGVPPSAAVAAPATAPAAVAGQAAPATMPPSAGGGDGLEHHDGHTLFEAPDGTEIDAYLSADGGAEADGYVLAVVCPSGHANPTHRTECRMCGARLAGDSVRMPRPSLGWLHTSAGESVELDRNVLAGRNPQASRIQGPVMPRLLPLPHSHVSGTHLEIRLDGWSVMVVDLDSTNGSFLQRPGQPTVRLSRSPQLLTSDDVVQLGHGVDLRFEALP